jgi:hypothetical protein
MAFTQDGSRLAIAFYYLRDPKDTSYSSRVNLLDPRSPYDEKYFDIESSSHAIVFSRIAHFWLILAVKIIFVF